MVWAIRKCTVMSGCLALAEKLVLKDVLFMTVLCGRILKVRVSFQRVGVYLIVFQKNKPYSAISHVHLYFVVM